MNKIETIHVSGSAVSVRMDLSAVNVHQTLDERYSLYKENKGAAAVKEMAQMFSGLTASVNPVADPASRVQ